MKRPPEKLPEPVAGASLRNDIGEGIRFVLGHPLLRVIAATTGFGNFFTAMLMATQTVFLVRVIGLEPVAIGLMLSASAVGGLAGALSAAKLADRLGQARIIWLSSVATGPFALLWPLSGPGVTAALFAIGSGVVFYGAVVYNVAQVSFRQALCPPRLLGRMNATLRFLVWGTLPLGAVVGGAVADAFDPRAALWLCAIGFLLVPLPLLLSPLRRMRDLPAAADDTQAPEDPATPDTGGPARTVTAR
jgi:MFS family permease